jgi:hypothetical protein
LSFDTLTGVIAQTTPIGKHPIPRVPDYRYCSRMDAAGTLGHYLAEWYLPELTEQSVDDIVARLDAAATTITDEGSPVRLLVTLAVPADEVLYGVFGAHSPDIVSRTCRQAGVPHQRLSGDVGTRIRQESPAAVTAEC